jgi:hypothetical protein
MPVVCMESEQDRTFLSPGIVASCVHEDQGTHPNTDIIRALPYLWSGDRRSM